MLHLQLSLWLGVSALYLGFAGVMGVLLRRTWHGSILRWQKELTAGYGLLLFVPASILMAGFPGWTPLGRLLTLALGLNVVGLAVFQPKWLPANVWRRAFGRRYFAGVMALAAFWGVNLSMATEALVPTLVAAAAGFAGVASLHSTQHIT